MTSSQQGSLSRLLVPGFRSFLAFLSRCRLWNYAITFVPLDSRPSSPICEAIKIKSFFTLGEWILANICATLQKTCICKLSQNLDWVTSLKTFTETRLGDFSNWTVSVYLGWHKDRPLFILFTLSFAFPSGHFQTDYAKPDWARVYSLILYVHSYVSTGKYTIPQASM